jgi:hypothetical protein
MEGTQKIEGNTTLVLKATQTISNYYYVNTYQTKITIGKQTYIIH